MTRPSGSALAACLVLVVLLVVCAVVATPLLLVIAAPVLAGLLATELDRSGGVIGTHIVCLAAWLLPLRLRKPNADEWTDHVLCVGEQGLRPVLVALTIALVVAPRMALRFWTRSAIGHYLLAVLGVVFSMKPTRPSSLTWVRSLISLMTLVGLPLVALIELVVRRPLRTSMRVIIGYTSVWAISMLASGLGFWLECLIVQATFLFGTGVVMVLVVRLEPILRIALRLIGVPEGETLRQAADGMAKVLRGEGAKALGDS